MRVAILGSFPLEPDRIPGGVEAVIHNLSRGLARLGTFDIHLVSCVHGLTEERSTLYEGMTIHYLPGQDRLGNVTDHVLEQKRMRATVAKIRPDIVHGHGTGASGDAALKTGLPCAITVHGILFREVVLFGGIKGRVRQWTTIRMERRVLARARDIFVISDYVRRAIQPFTTATLHPVTNPVALHFFETPSTESSPVVLSVAAIQPRKGLLDLIEAMVLVRKAIPAARLRLVGKVLSPDYAKKLHDRISALGLGEAVTLVGFVPDEQLRREYSAASVLALCSVEESSPVAIAEAMALGKPVVATRVGGVADLVTPDATGFLVDYGDVSSIAGAITRLLADPGLRKSFSETARARALRDFHPDAAARRTAEVYHQILSRSGSPA